MSIKEQVQAAKNEFGEKAFERFGFAYMGDGIGLSNPLCNSDVEFYDCPVRPLPELYAHDDSYYIDAFTMWQWRYVDNSNDWTDYNKPLSFKADKEYRRKTV